MNDVTQELKTRITVDGAQQAQSKLGGMTASIGKMAAQVGLAALTYKALSTAMKLTGESSKLYEQQIIAVRQVDAVLQSTGRSAEFTTGELEKMASALQRVSNFGDEDILVNATASLLRFSGITKEMFPRVQALTVDLAQAMGGLENASKTLGISIDDPILGMTRLRRVGVMLTESQQELIKSMVSAGDKAGAQTILMDALESKYKGLAAASISASTQMKNAWGDYLEYIGSTVGVFDGAKRAIAIALMDITADVDITSKEARKQALLNQQNFGETIIKITGYAKAGITLLGGYWMGWYNLVKSGLDVLPAGAKASFDAIVHNWVVTAKALINANPFSIMLKGYEKLVEVTTGKKLNLDFGTRALTDLLDSLDTDTSKSFDKLQVALGDSKERLGQWYKNLKAVLPNTSEAIDRQIAQLQESINTAIAGMDIVAPPLFEDGDGAGAAAATQAATDARIKALAAYYDVVGKYTDNWVNTQLDAYNQDLQSSLGAILSAEQMAAMSNVKRQELIDAQLAYFQDAEQARMDIIKEQYQKEQAAAIAHAEMLQAAMMQSIDLELSVTTDRNRFIDLRIQKLDEEVRAYEAMQVNAVVLAQWRAAQEKAIYADLAVGMQTMNEQMTKNSIDAAQKIGRGAFNLLSDGLYKLMSGADNLRDVWKNTMEAMLQITIRAVAEMIAELMKLAMMKIILGVATAGASTAAGAAAGVVGDFVPSPIDLAGYGGNNSNIGITGGGDSSVNIIRAINDLRAEMANDREQNFNLYLDGMSLRNGVQRVERNLNTLGGAR